MKTIVFLTGATGTMGFAGMTEILKYPEHYELRILARPSQKNKELLSKLSTLNSQLHIIWGDLTKYEDVLKGVTGADIVLHVGGMVSPQADYRPKATLRTNITAAQNITKAVASPPIRVCPSAPVFQNRIRNAGVTAREIHNRMEISWIVTRVLPFPNAPLTMVAYTENGLSPVRMTVTIAQKMSAATMAIARMPMAFPSVT